VNSPPGSITKDFRLHRIHKMQTIANDHRCSCLSVSLSCSFIRLWCAITAEWIEVMFEVKTLMGPKNIVLDGGSQSPDGRQGMEVGSGITNCRTM